ncbi:type II toxin-antitoxin system RelE/ParE family toxin [Galbibacter sp. EGI 63066]|uniref:type II toxin-antitoxin system RelE/ParE family toxin n=1 Tax=Galbibacter sp. EGI 63066 TaxID=2993559 RepID=UPI003A522097
MLVVWSEEAKNSLTDIYDYIFSDSPQNAEMVLDTLLELGNSLGNPSAPQSLPTSRKNKAKKPKNKK